MSAQQFATVDRAALEVAGAPLVVAPGEVVLPQLVKNSRGDLGAWWWLSPVTNTRVLQSNPPAPGDISGSGLRFQTLATQATHFTSEFMPLTATHVKGSFSLVGSTTGVVGVRARFAWYDADLVLISSSAQTAVTTVAATYQIAKVAKPAAAVYAKLRFDLYRSAGNPSANDLADLDNLVVVNGTSAELDSASIQLDDGWVNVLGPTHEVTIERAELNLGTLTATILDSTLDPSQAGLLRKGRPVRFTVDRPINPDPDELFAGEILDAKVIYDLDPSTPDEKRARITLTAVDATTRLANSVRSDGVASIDDLPHVLEGVGIPWICNGNSGHLATVPAVVSVNDNAYAVDQVAITRDSEHGHAWVSRSGVLNVWDPATLATWLPGPFGILDETVYNPGVAVDFDTDRCINTVTITYLRFNSATGESEEVKYGPYVDTASVSKWGAHAAEFTIHGVVDDEATMKAFAATVLAANATPAVRITEATIPLNTLDDLDDWSILDLFDLVTLNNTELGITDDQRVTTLTHRITGDSWLVTAGFTVDGSVAQPQITPDLPPRPSTWWPEVRMLHGAKALCPPDFLVMDGGAFDVAVYPELAAHLQALGLAAGVLPDYTDKFPIGAGTKALGTSGGNPTKPVPPHVHPGAAHTHPIPTENMNTAANTTITGAATRLVGPAAHNHGGATGNNSAGDTGAANGAAFDVMNPWRAIYFVIRGR